MPSRRASRNPGPRRRAKRSSFELPRMPQLEQRHFDIIGLGLVAFAVLMAFVFYLGWDGGEVGEGLATGFVFLCGGVAYLLPIVLFGAGALMVLRPMIPSVRPWGTGTACLLGALMLGLAAGSLGLGPHDPPRDGQFMQPDFFRERGGAIGEALFWIARALVQEAGAHILFTFLLLTGLLLLTGASVAGVLRATREGVAVTTRRVRQSTTEFAAVVTGRGRGEGAGDGEPEMADGRWQMAGESPGLGGDEEGTEALEQPPEVEPLVRATHVEVPSQDEPAEDDETIADEESIAEGAGAGPTAGHDLAAVRKPVSEAELTPQGRFRAHVTEADDFDYSLPRPTSLRRSGRSIKVDTRAQEGTGRRLVEALSHFGVQAQVVGTVTGPRVTRYELRLSPGIKMSKVSQLKDDLAYALAATDVRILAPIPGQQAVGVEVPNRNDSTVRLGDVFGEAPAGWSPLTVWLGKDIAGNSIGTDLAKQPHVLVAGTTGSGKSACVNAMLSSILLRATPREVKLVLVDPKQVELNHYESIPHLLTPVVTSPRIAANVLSNLIREMEQRYSVMSLARARSLVELNRIREAGGERPLPYILCVIDELADLMMVAPGEVEDAIIRLAQKSRAVGIHLLLATQRPSADIITGMIKANVPARIAFAVSSQIDSRVILDQNGAESLLGRGDMLFRPASESRAARIQGALIEEDEVERLTDHWRRQGEPELHAELLEAVERPEDEPDELDADSDELLGEAVATVVQMGTASTSMLQRRLRVGYTRAGRLIDMMERRGVISGYEGSKARHVLITEADLPRVLAALDEPVGSAPEPSA